MNEQERLKETKRRAEEHAKEKGIPEGSTPEAVAEEEQSGGALTNRDSEGGSTSDEAEEPPSPS
jgi:hypothetical protein